MRLFALLAICMLAIVAGQMVLFHSTFHDIDEASYAYIAQQWLDGKLPYRDVFDNKLPGIFIIYGVGLALTPHSMLGIRILGFLAMALTMGLTLRWTKNAFKSDAVTIATAFIGVLLFLHTGIEAEAVLTELFSLPFLILGLLEIPSARKTGLHSVIRGVAGGICVLINGQSLIIQAGTWIASLHNEVKRLPHYLIGMAIPAALVLIYFWFADQWNGLIQLFTHFLPAYQRTHFLSAIGMQYAWDLFARVFPFIILAAIGLFLLHRQKKNEWHVLGAMAFSTIVALILLGSFYPHHGMLLWPVLTILGGFALGSFLQFAMVHAPNSSPRMQKIAWLFPILFLSALCISVGWSARTFTWSPEPSGLQSMGTIIQAATPNHEPIMVWGYRTELYWYAQRSAPTPFANTLTLFNGDGSIDATDLQRLESDFQSNPPAVMIVTNPQFLHIPELEPVFLNYVPTQYDWLFLRAPPKGH